MQPCLTAIIIITTNINNINIINININTINIKRATAASTL